MKKSILLVDDKQEIAKIIRLYLSAFDITYIENPTLAIEWLAEGNRPDLIISDINMPEMTGEEFLVYLKSNEALTPIPVFILSSVDGDQDRQRLFAKGAADYIVKPFNPEELKMRVNMFLDNKE